MPVDFGVVFKAEREAIAERRRLRIEGATEATVNQATIEHDLFGICFSGGGIRSATLNLGVLQGLAERRLLRLADYLSTVSGGGYIGSWFQALCKRYTTSGRRIVDVEKYLEHETRNPQPPANDPITFLRKYSNYLAPQLGLLSADTWVIFTIWLRNTLLNQIVLALTLSGALLLPLVLGNLLSPSGSVWKNNRLWPYLNAALIVACLGWAVSSMSANLRTIVARQFALPLPAKTRDDDDRAVWTTVVAPVFTGAWLLSWLMSAGYFHPVGDAWRTGLLTAVSLLSLFSISLWTGGFPQCSEARWKDDSGDTQSFFRLCLGVAIVLCCTAVSAGLLTGIEKFLLPAIGSSIWLYLALGPLAVVLALAGGVGLQVGLMGVDFPDSAREWYSRLAAKLLIVGLVWTLAFMLVAFAPVYVLWLFEHHSYVSTGGVVAWLLTTFAGFQAGKSPSTAGTPPANSAAPASSISKMDLIAKIAPPIAVAGLLIAISTTSFWAIEKIWPMHQPVAPVASLPSSVQVSAQGPGDLQVKWSQSSGGSLWSSWLRPRRDYRPLALEAVLNAWVFLAAGLLMTASFLLSWRVNINEFSMNHFYKNRLVRCYLGATQGAAARHANPFTGFDPHDDIPLTDLVPGAHHDAPYPIVNCALNLNQGAELAWQERKASSFIFTPRYCGYTPAREDSQGQGYMPTGQFTGKGGPHIGLATAISGAAANPNWGYHTSPVTAFLMTVFNVRLGWWIGNTRIEEAAKTPGPSVALWYLFREMFGLTDELCPYLNLSDGGHFENLGLYELIRRKCQYIIVSDGEQDENYVFESLGGAIRKARIDFGASIDIQPKRIVLQDGESAVHCAMGTITYNNGQPGHLLYIKSSLSGDEDYDITQYKKQHDAFPQESTLDQFFTESQFESYRALGRHIVDRIFEKTDKPEDHAGLVKLFRDLRSQWLPPASAPPGAFTEHAQTYSALLKRLSDDHDLRFLDSELLPGFRADNRPDDASPAARKATLLVTDFIQLMENVYVDLNLEDTSQREHEQNQGWIVLFKHWRKPDTLLDTVWQRVGHTYSKGFQRFYNNL